MTNVIEFISCFLDIVIVFIYFNGVLERKESIGKIFWVYFCMAVLINFARTNLYLSLARVNPSFCVNLKFSSKMMI